MSKKYSVTLLLRQIGNDYERSLNEKVKSIGLTASQFEVLNYLFQSDQDLVNQKDIEDYLHLSNPTVTGVLRRMEEKGFILSVPNETDRRKKNIFLTQKALNLEKKMDSCYKQMEEETIGALTTRETERLEKLLLKISEEKQ